MIRVFKSRLIRDLLSGEELEALIKDFTSYKSTGVVPDNFGRDVPYDHPHTMPIVMAEEVQHIHMGSADQPLPLDKFQFHRTSDIHLVYCQGASSEDVYLLMTILAPNGHDLAKSRDIMFQLGKILLASPRPRGAFLRCRLNGGMMILARYLSTW